MSREWLRAYIIYILCVWKNIPVKMKRLDWQNLTANLKCWINFANIEHVVLIQKSSYLHCQLQFGFRKYTHTSCEVLNGKCHHNYFAQMGSREFICIWIFMCFYSIFRYAAICRSIYMYIFLKARIRLCHVNLCMTDTVLYVNNCYANFAT